MTAALPMPACASAHASLATAEPGIGATLGATPASVRLSFTEEPQASLSEIQVLGPGGEEARRGEPQPAAGDPLALSVPVAPLSHGVYTVDWKVVSAVDGHATSGSYAFGVGESPADAAATAGTTTDSVSRLELLARWTLLLGIVALLGATVAAVARFGGASGSDLALACGGWAVSILGLLLLTAAQRGTAGSSLGALLATPVGEALVRRGLALALAGVALAVAWRSPTRRRPAMALAALAAFAAIVAHVAAGHAAAGSWSSLITVTAQAAHFAAAAIWFGGLAALLLGIRGAPPAARSAAVRRFGALAFAALIVVVLTGVLRAVDELSSWGQLLDSGYGRAVLAKVVLIAAIAGLAARNRRRNVPTAAADPGPLRRTASIELALAVAALGVAALLGTLAPPVGGQSSGPTGISVSGSDFATTTRVELSTASNRPGPNRFEVRVEDYDSRNAVAGATVSLTFTPLDDPGVPPSTLKLAPGADGAYTGSGANLAFDGRWGVEASIERDGDGVEVPLELDLPGPKQSLSVLRIPGRIPKYTLQVGALGDIRIEPDPQRAGPSKIYVTCYTPFGSQSIVEQLVVTVSAGDGPARQIPVRRVDVGRYVADATLPAGPVEIGAVAHTRFGHRLRGVFEIEVPGG